MKALPTFDGNFVAFGQIIDGDYVLRKMNDMPVKYPEHPSQAVKITDCSVIYNSFE
jgi:cyclophilin family peptidyl-prolyl cis-trans isomerase